MIKNKRIYIGPGRTIETLKELQLDYEDMGFESLLENDCLTVFVFRHSPELSYRKLKEQRGKFDS